MPAPTPFGADGANDVFLHLQMKRAGKIKGEASSKGHVDDIVVNGLSWGLAASSAIGSTQATARRSYKAVTITKGIDRASTPLMSALATNDEVKEALIALRRAGGQQDEYFTIKLSSGRIASLDQTVDASGNGIETFTIVFNKIDVEYRLQQSAGGAGGTSTFSDEIYPA
jgi:type VI secretion system secreted protein Hcp